MCYHEAMARLSLASIQSLALLLVSMVGGASCANGENAMPPPPSDDASHKDASREDATMPTMRNDARTLDSQSQLDGRLIISLPDAPSDEGGVKDGASDGHSGCGSNADCVNSPGKVCGGGACVACIDDTTCAAPTPKCDTTTNTCVACLAPGDCMAGFVCTTSDTCAEGCSATQPCPGGQVCNAGGCVQCAMDSDCSGATPRCDTMTNTCVQCLPASDNCGLGLYCTGTTCAGGCKSSADCAGADAGADTVCKVATHVCVQCLGDGDCAATQVCGLDNQCTTGCDTAHPCMGGMSCCSGFCEALDTTSNCGACGITCDTTSGHSLGATCNGTGCVYAGCATGWYDCNQGVPDSNGCDTNLAAQGQKVCGDGACVAVSSCCTASDCQSPPSPQECYGAQGLCVEGSPCSYTLNQGSAICGGTCCNAIDGTCNANCTLSCNAGRANCSGHASSGCETDDTTAADCGGCRACSSDNVMSPVCTGGLCESTCQPGWGNCAFPAAPAPDDGCESNLTICAGTACCATGMCQANHSDGIGQTYSDCTPFGTPGNAATYTENMAIECLDADPIHGGPNGSMTCNDPAGGKDDCLYNSCNNSTECPTGVTAECGVWCYTGSLAGYVKLTTGSATCVCPTTASSTWN